MAVDRWQDWRLYQEYVRCGNPRCRSCPHGPYWYGYQEASGKTRKRYFGRKRPDSTEDRPKTSQSEPDEVIPAFWQLIFQKNTASALVASTILGMNDVVLNRQKLDAAFRAFSLREHPDRGGSARRMAAGNCAYSYLKSVLSHK